MNGYQVSKMVQKLLRDRLWGGSGSNVFSSNSVRVTPMDIETLLATGVQATPMCKINLGRRNSDSQAKGYVALELEITLAVQVEGDEVGENATIGANRSAGSTYSGGRGLSEVESEMFAVLQDVTAMNGMQVQGYSTSSQEVTKIDVASNYVYCVYTFLFFCTTQLTYLGPTSLVVSGATGGTASLSWVPTPLGWSSIAGANGQIVRWTAGATAPQTPTAGSGVGVSATTGISTSATITGLASGTYSVSVFTMYQESGASSGSDAYSPPTSYTVVIP